MTRILGVLGLLLALYGTLIASDPNAGDPGNLKDVANIQGLFGVITLGAALVIIVGGIDLSIGAVVGCSAILFGALMTNGLGTGLTVHPFVAFLIVIGFGVLVGLTNGVLITRLKLQPFLVTLCGMFVYRGVARLLGGTIGLGSINDVHPEFKDSLRTLRYLFIGKSPTDGELLFPAQFVLLLLLAAVVGFFLHRTAYGRYWCAIGHSELAARYAGVNVNRQRVVIYTICSALASLAGVMLFLDRGTVQSDNAGVTFELYAILGAVLGGCSLRGGEGTAVGMVLGAMVLPVLENLVTFRGAKSDVIPLVIGLTLLVGAIVDELIRRRSRVHG